MGTRFIRAGILTTAILCLAGAWPGHASATHVRCGDTINQDTVLDSDLIDCQEDGIVIGADNITLDLNGHTVDGDRTRFLCCWDGVRNTGGFDNIVVKDGTIQEFELGIQMIDASNNAVLHNLLLRDNGRGIELTDSNTAWIARNIATNNAIGIAVYGSTSFSVPTGNRITGNVASGNGSRGIFLGQTSDTLIRNNRLSSNGAGIDASGSVNPRIERNQVIDNTGTGIFIEREAHGAVVANNVVTGNFGGVLLSEDAHSNTVIRNQVRGNDWIGIAMDFSDSNLIEGNTVRRNGSGGVYVLRGVGNQIVDNSIEDNLYGVLLREAQNTRVERNNTHRNADDGIHLESGPGNVLTANTANRNGDYGIEATPEVIDGGGNRAKGNGNPAQCLNVTCSK